MFAIPRPCWLHKSCSANLTHVILKILLFEEKICTSGPEVLVNTCDPPFTILDICNDLLTHVLKVIKRRFYMSKTFWPRCRLIWTASCRFCMNSFGQRWQRNSWKVHRNILFYSIFSILKVQTSKLNSVQFFYHPWDSTAMWDLNLYSSMLSLMIIPRTVETKSEEIVFVLSEEEISHLLSHPSCLHR